MNPSEPAHAPPPAITARANEPGNATANCSNEFVADCTALALLDQVSRHLGAAIALIDKHGQWIFASDAFCRLLSAAEPGLRTALAEWTVAWLALPTPARTPSRDPRLQAFNFHELSSDSAIIDSTESLIGAGSSDNRWGTYGYLCLLTSMLPCPDNATAGESQTPIATLQQQAMTDPLTGLFNRRYIDLEATRLLETSRQTGHPLSVIMLDLDHFKLINDTHGHQTGDHVLRIVASRIKAAIRPQDRACRYGGEEFLVLLPDTSLETATFIAERIRARLNEPLNGDKPMRLSASAGVSAVTETEVDIGPAVSRSDQALYAAKSAGRNCVHAAR